MDQGVGGRALRTVPTRSAATEIDLWSAQVHRTTDLTRAARTAIDGHAALLAPCYTGLTLARLGDAAGEFLRRAQRACVLNAIQDILTDHSARGAWLPEGLHADVNVREAEAHNEFKLWAKGNWSC